MSAAATYARFLQSYKAPLEGRIKKDMEKRKERDRDTFKHAIARFRRCFFAHYLPHLYALGLERLPLGLVI